jgi:hypothetical protein
MEQIQKERNKARVEAAAAGFAADAELVNRRALTDRVYGVAQLQRDPGTITERRPEFRPYGDYSLEGGALNNRSFQSDLARQQRREAMIEQTPDQYQHFADGGATTANKPIVVGEKGPEVFVPNQDGTVVPNNMSANLLRQGGGNDALGNLLDRRMNNQSERGVPGGAKFHRWTEHYSPYIKNIHGMHDIWPNIAPADAPSLPPGTVPMFGSEYDEQVLEQQSSEADRLGIPLADVTGFEGKNPGYDLGLLEAKRDLERRYQELTHRLDQIRMRYKPETAENSDAANLF